MVGRSDPVALGMRQQQLHDVAAETVLPEERRRSASGAVRRKIRYAEVKTLEEVIQRRIPQRDRCPEDRRKDIGLRL